MTGEAVLIAGYSGRALAQSARRAGYVPLVADAFGDLDMREAAHDFEVVPGAMESGFRTKPVVAALDKLVARAPSKPIGLVLGSGLEDKLRLWDLLDKRYRVLGCSAETVRKCKDPRIFFPLLDELGIPHPEWRMEPPADPSGWISKRIGGSGGRHIRFADAASRAKPKRYFQKVIEGVRVSISAVSSNGMINLLTRQWTAPAPRQEFRYGGCVSIEYTDQLYEQSMIGISNELARQFRMKGLLSFDFVIHEDKPYLLEINPRSGGSLDAVETVDGGLFTAHIHACRDGFLKYWGSISNEGHRCAAILHADRGEVTLGKIDWPEWSADRGAPGTHVPQFAPLATIFARGPTADAAEALARERLAILADLIYGHSE